MDMSPLEACFTIAFQYEVWNLEPAWPELDLQARVWCFDSTLKSVSRRFDSVPVLEWIVITGS